jgi:hypothetical protein
MTASLPTPRVEDDVLHAGVAAVQVQDVAAGGGVAQPVADVLDSVGRGRRAVQVTERDQLEGISSGASVRSSW